MTNAGHDHARTNRRHHRIARIALLIAARARYRQGDYSPCKGCKGELLLSHPDEPGSVMCTGCGTNYPKA